MPIKQSGKKELRKSKKLAAFNSIRKKNIKDTIKKIHKAIVSENVDEAKKLAKEVVKMLDKAAKRNIVHKNTASRKKKRM